MAMAHTMEVDVYIDLVCPWCLIGKRHLDDAVHWFKAIAPQVPVTVQWHSVQLLPDAPPQGWDFHSFYVRRLGSEEALSQRQAQVRAAAAQAGVHIDFSTIPHMPNTLLAHQLLNFASARLSAAHLSDLLERLFAAHFQQSRNIGERNTLLAIATDMGLDGHALQAWWDSGSGVPLPQAVAGVPYFVFNRKLALSGAQPAQVLVDAMQQALQAPAKPLAQTASRGAQ